jgi:hypothetical protein
MSIGSAALFAWSGKSSIAWGRIATGMPSMEH